MNKIILIIYVLLFALASSAAEKVSFGICKQKLIPFEVSTHYAQNLLQIKLKAEANIEDFNITNVRGLDGIAITKFQEIKNMNIMANEIVDTQVEISNLSGQAFVVLDVEYKQRGILNKKNITIPVGNLSTVQRNERKKNIKTIKTRKHIKDTHGNAKATSETTTENVHYMKID